MNSSNSIWIKFKLKKLKLNQVQVLIFQIEHNFKFWLFNFDLIRLHSQAEMHVNWSHEWWVKVKYNSASESWNCGVERQIVNSIGVAWKKLDQKWENYKCSEFNQTLFPRLHEGIVWTQHFADYMFPLCISLDSYFFF